jgi:hypothetical protein
VALAASERVDTHRGIFEPTHRDSLRIIGLTTTIPPYVACWQNTGCQSVPGEIDSFLPITYPDHLVSNVHYPIGLGHAFQDFTYSIDSSLKSLTFAFASTDYPEKVGIDSVRITGDLLVVPVEIDIKPNSCPNALNIDPKGILTVAILGTADLDITSIDLASVRLEGVAPIRSSINDVATPVVDPQPCECNSEGEDGYDDLILKFRASEVVDVLPEVQLGGEVKLTLTGSLNDETPIEGKDCIVFVGKEKKD